LIALLIIIETEEFFIAMDSGWSMCLALLPKLTVFIHTHHRIIIAVSVEILVGHGCGAGGYASILL
jgi:hypothetical protein